MFRQLLCLVFLFPLFGVGQNWEVTEVGVLPEPVSNNAICEGLSPSGNYLYSFGGIDSTLSHNGIHLKCWRVNTDTYVAEPIPDLPDTLGKIAAAATRVGDVIYIMGGYHVFANGNELSSDKVHRFSVSQNQYLSDGAPIPVPIDDHVQCVYKDSLIFLVTGWSNTGNVPDVQIYNTYTDSWTVGTSVPNNNSYRCFGASGQIIGDTLFYYGGAAGFNFNGQSRLRKGYIDPSNPTSIEWFVKSVPTPNYRSAAVTTEGVVHWLGGSAVTYNYNGIAYNGSGLVSPSAETYYYLPESGEWGSEAQSEIPMDLRGAAQISPTGFFIAGGITNGGVVSDKLLRLEYVGSLDRSENEHSKSLLTVAGNLIKPRVSGNFSIIRLDGSVCLLGSISASETIDVRSLSNGIYLLRFVDTDNNLSHIKIPVFK